MKDLVFLDCTLRDGGYYNNWDFEPCIVQDYLNAMDSLKIDFVEIGFRTLSNEKFKGAFAYSSDKFLNELNIPIGLVNKIGVMINGSEIANPDMQLSNLKKLFNHKSKSPVSLVRIACHVDEFIKCLPATKWLKKQGYLVGFNLMQASDHPLEKIYEIAKAADSYPIDVLYFADSMGNLNSEHLRNVVQAFQKEWKGAMGIHTHDNIGQAVNNTIEAIKCGVTWVDSTVTGMGRGPGNAQTEYIVFALSNYKKKKGNFVKLLKLVEKYFKPMKNTYGWGTNPFYYLAGQNSIHPTYIQEMLQDKRYSEEDILAVIDFLKINGGKKFNFNILNSARQFYSDKPQGLWKPSKLLKDKIILILGSGPGIKKYQLQIEGFIKREKPHVMALNLQTGIKQSLINNFIACHPVRLLADCNDHAKLTQPLITPYSMLPESVKQVLKNKQVLDFGILTNRSFFKFHKNYCEIPTPLVFAYSLAIANSGRAKKIFLAGFDGFDSDDARRVEINNILKLYKEASKPAPILSITPTKFDIVSKSIFGL